MGQARRIVMVGGGTGGHITPLLSVAHELKRQHPDWQIGYVGQKGDRFARLSDDAVFDSVKLIHSGKLRRYHGVPLLRQLLDIRTQLRNAADMFKVLYGTAEAWSYLGTSAPDAVFIKGGYVSVPIAWAARLRRIPYITHDSDAVPGLANRLVSKHAAWHATGMPTRFYHYPHATTSHTGVPVSEHYWPLDDKAVADARSALGITANRFVVLVIGGSLGARRLNELVVAASPRLVEKLPGILILHLSGHSEFESVSKAYERELGSGWERHAKVMDFSDRVHLLAASSDIVISRAGATTLAEMAILGKCCIIVPNPDLTGGHQLHNSALLQKAGAIVEFMQDSPPAELAETIISLSADSAARQSLAAALSATAKTDAAKQLAALIETTASRTV